MKPYKLILLFLFLSSICAIVLYGATKWQSSVMSSEPRNIAKQGESPQSFPSSLVKEKTPDPFFDGCFVDDNNAWVFKMGAPDFTNDGGKSWHSLFELKREGHAFPLIRGSYTRVYFINPKQGWLSGEDATYETKDGGLTWRKILPPFLGITFSDSQHGWMKAAADIDVRGSGYETKERSWITKDGGRNWRPCGNAWSIDEISFGTETFFLTTRVGWAIASVKTQGIYKGRKVGGVLQTKDGGCHWNLLWKNDENPDVTYNDIYFLNESEGWLAGNAGLDRTRDGGNSWDEMQLPTDSMHVHRVYFNNSQEGWVIGSPHVPELDPGVFYTSNGGETWRRLSVGEIVPRDEGLKTSPIPNKWKKGQLFRMLVLRTL